MIQDLDNSLQKLLETELLGALSTSVAIVFDAPDDKFHPNSSATVDFFLYDIRENLQLRSNEWLLERQSNGIVSKQPPLVRVDFSYMITAWSGDTKSDHSLLSEVMKVLLRHPTLPENVLQGSLAGQQPPLPTSSLQAPRLQSMGEFWQALGGKPKAALHYTVTIGVEPYRALDEQLVIDTRYQLRQGLKEG